MYIDSADACSSGDDMQPYGISVHPVQRHGLLHDFAVIMATDGAEAQHYASGQVESDIEYWLAEFSSFFFRASDLMRM